MTESLYDEAHALVQLLKAQRMTLATAESCTGGLIAKLITDVPGSSAVLAGGVVSYTNEVKTRVLGVDSAIIERDTEVSHACANAMADEVRRLMNTDCSVSTTGYAGPGGGTEKDPVGTVYLGVSTPTGSFSERFCAPAGTDRSGVREAAACRAMELLMKALKEV